jgi:hypothetical protein
MHDVPTYPMPISSRISSVISQPLKGQFENNSEQNASKEVSLGFIGFNAKRPAPNSSAKRVPALNLWKSNVTDATGIDN